MTTLLNPEAGAGENCRGAKTNAAWLRAECAARIAQGQSVVVVATPTKEQALTYVNNIAEEDEIVWPRMMRGSRKKRSTDLVDKRDVTELNASQSEAQSEESA